MSSVQNDSDIEAPLLSSALSEARICPGVGHVARVMRDRGQTRGRDGSTLITQPVSHSDTSIQLAATPRPLLPSMVTKYLDGKRPAF